MVIDTVHILFKEIAGALRPSEGIKELDYALDAVDEIAARENHRIHQIPDTVMSKRLKIFCTWMNGITHSFQIAYAYIAHNRPIQAKEAISEARNCLEKGKEICISELGEAPRKNFAYLMDVYHQSLFEDISQKLV